jgi:hypothetical protein
MSAIRDAPQQASGDADMGRSGELAERGYYGRALRAGQVPKYLASKGHTLNVLLWGLNVVLWLLGGALLVWRLYAVYIAGGEQGNAFTVR